MKKTTRSVFLCFLSILSGLVISCSNSDSSKGKIKIGIRAINSSTISTSNSRLRSISYPKLSANDFRSDSIASGPPDEFIIFITHMELVSDDGDSRTIFDAPEGKPIKINGSQIDMSSLFTNYACVDDNGNPVELPDGQSCPCGLDEDNTPILLDETTGECPIEDSPEETTPPDGVMDVDTGTYIVLRVTYLRKARIKGCITGNFSDSSNFPGTHTYCTRTSHSTFQDPPGGQNSDFENQTPELMDFDLLGGDIDSTGGFTTDTTLSFQTEYPIKDKISIEKNETAQLTLLIDVNRILRFFNQGRSDQAPMPALPANKSYFFTSIFESSGFGFVGYPGSIKGYSFATVACTEATAIPSDHICNEQEGGLIVTGWFTYVQASDGNPMLAYFQPDDDNTLTVLKGSNRTFVDNFYIPDPNLITTNSDGTLNIQFTLGIEGGGTVFGVNPNIEISESSEAYFEGLQNSYGILSFTREL